MADAGLLLVAAPRTAGSIPQYDVSPLDPLQQAAWHGIDKEQLGVLVANAGLPLSLGEMLQLLNRKHVTDDDVKRAIAHSNLRNEYMDVALELRRRLLTPHEYAELALRAWISPDEMHAGAQLSGMEQGDVDLLFKMLGRPLAAHQITTGLARGGTYGGDYAGVPEPYNKALRESNVRPEWGNLAYANRYSYPSAFVLRALAQAGELTEPETHTILLEIGWPPALVAKIAPQWAGGTAAKADPHITKADTQLWNTIHKAYVDSAATDAHAESVLAEIGVAAATIPEVLARWRSERAVTRSLLSPTQIKKAIGQPGKDHAWALAQLEERGYTAADAETFLAE
jgi:hypothetical protein